MLSSRPAVALSAACALILTACGPNEPEPPAKPAPPVAAGAPAAPMNPADPFGTQGPLAAPAPGAPAGAAAPVVPGAPAGPVAAVATAPGQAPLPGQPPVVAQPPARPDSAARRPNAPGAPGAPNAGRRQGPDPAMIAALMQQMPVSQYRLSMDGVAKMRQAALNLAELGRTRPDLQQNLQMQRFDPEGVYQRLNAVPEAREAVQNAGLSTRDYADAMTALIQGMMVYQLRKAGQNPPIQANEANVRFIAQNEAQLMAMMRPPQPPRAAQPAAEPQATAAPAAPAQPEQP
ncbi:MAG TPA: hypothetical protein VF665_09480 [Longimicrobium sp.]|uniref:hypothetical protein n=1 Tax=Longimicrobium sp. TaxID=2029185 RepID=UPI002ED78108